MAGTLLADSGKLEGIEVDFTKGAEVAEPITGATLDTATGILGSLDGWMDGFVDGDVDLPWALVGFNEGAFCLTIGAEVKGATVVGSNEGSTDGSKVGLEVGLVGERVGFLVGPTGAFVGFCVGTFDHEG